jgi:tRNA(Ile)-lysidine synthase TilS/MesJ
MGLFESKAPAIMAGLMRDLGVQDYQAAGVLGSLGHETGGFTDLVQGTVMDPRDMSANAVGWAQWDGVRKRDFLAWCAKQGLDWRSDEANYRYLLLELRGSERAALNALLKTRSLIEATDVFEAKFERAGVPALASRRKYARQAMDAYAASDKKPIMLGLPPPVIQPRPPDDPGVEPSPPAASGGFFMRLLRDFFQGLFSPRQ